MEFDAVEMFRERHAAWRLLRARQCATGAVVPRQVLRRGQQRGDGRAELASARSTSISTCSTPVPPSRASIRSPKRVPRQTGRRPRPDGFGGSIRSAPTKSTTTRRRRSRRPTRGSRRCRAGSFVGTESRLHTVVELLRQIVARHRDRTRRPAGRTPPAARRRSTRRSPRSKRGDVPVLDATGRSGPLPAVREHRPRAAVGLPRGGGELPRSRPGARERIAAWEGRKGELLAELVGSRADISGSDQGRSFQAFYDFLLSESTPGRAVRAAGPRPALDASRGGRPAPHASTTTGRRRLNARSRPSGRSPSSSAGSSTTRSGWRTAGCSTWSGRSRPAALACRDGAAADRARDRRARHRASRCRSSGRCTARSTGGARRESRPTRRRGAARLSSAARSDLRRSGPAGARTSAPSCRSGARRLLGDIIDVLSGRAGCGRDRRLPGAHRRRPRA